MRERNVDQPRTNRCEQSAGCIRRNDQQDARRRFLEKFQQRVCGLAREIRITQNEDAFAAGVGVQRELPHEIARGHLRALVKARAAVAIADLERTFGKKEIGMRAGLHA